MLIKDNIEIAVLIPCYNEETTIGNVVKSFKNCIPNSTVYVYDNLSSDNTVEAATRSGATVMSEPSRGKGNVVRRMFADINADIYVIVDGDDTYEIPKCLEMIECLYRNNLDMVVGVRNTENNKGEYPWGHTMGNWILTRTVSFIFGFGFTDMLSGYRVMSNRFVKSFPIMSKGFEIETEMTVHALQVGVSFQEIQTNYNPRPDGSESKLSTFKDGFKILGMILTLFKENRPLYFFSIFSFFFFMISLILAIPIFSTYVETGLVPRLPTAILSTGLMILAFLSLISGVILDSLSRSRLEVKKNNYLAYKSLK